MPDHRLELLRAVPSFRDVPPGRLRELTRLLDVVTVEPGDVLERRAGPADEPDRDEYLVIVDGTARVRRDGVDLRLLDGGDVVGEAGLLRHEPGVADVVALTPLTVLVGAPRDFDRVRGLLPGWAAVVDRVDAHAAA